MSSFRIQLRKSVWAFSERVWPGKAVPLVWLILSLLVTGCVNARSKRLVLHPTTPAAAIPDGKNQQPVSNSSGSSGMDLIIEANAQAGSAATQTTTDFELSRVSIGGNYRKSEVVSADFVVTGGVFDGL